MKNSKTPTRANETIVQYVFILGFWLFLWVWVGIYLKIYDHQARAAACQGILKNSKRYREQERPKRFHCIHLPMPMGLIGQTLCLRQMAGIYQADMRVILKTVLFPSAAAS